MNERRQHSRHSTQRSIEVIHHHSGESIGRLVDLSFDGFMLASEQPPAADSVCQCRLVLDEPINGISEIILGADCLWSREAEVGHTGWSGFHIIDIADDMAQALDILLEQLKD